MDKYIWIVLFAALIGLGVDAVQWQEGPNAQRMNQMSEEAPHGPWSWQGGD